MRITVLAAAAALALCVPRAQADLASCRAAYEAHDAVGVCEECAELVLDGAVPEDPDVWIYLGLARWKLGEIDQQIINRTYAKASGTGRTSPWDLLQEGRYDEARAFGTWFTARAWFREWNDLKDELKPKDQLPYLDRAIELEPHHDILLKRGRLLASMGKKDLAMRDFWQSHRICGQVSAYSEARDELKILDPKGLEASRHRKDAVLSYREGLWLDRRTATEEQLAEEAYADWNPDACLEHAEAALAADPGSTIGLLFRAIAQLDRNDTDAAAVEADLTEVLRREPGNARAHLHHGMSLRRLGRGEEALAAIDHALDLDPDLRYPDGSVQRAWTLAGLGRTDEALAEFNACQRAVPGARSVWVEKANFLAESGRHAEAQKVATGLIGWADVVTNRRFRGELAARIGNDELAIRELATAVERDESLNNELYPLWSAALARVREKRCATPAANLRESLMRRGTWTLPAGNTTARMAPPGFLTQWQADGSLKVFLEWGPGFHLLEDGVSYRKIQDDGTLGPVTEPEILADGRMIYPLAHMVLIHVPSGDIYFGFYELWAGRNEGSYSDCADLAQEGPFRFGLSAHQRRVVEETDTEYTVDGETRVLTLVKLADGTECRFVKATSPEAGERERSVTIPSLGRFVGETMTLDHCAPQRGVMYYNNGSWGIIHDMQLRTLGTQGQPLTFGNMSLSAGGLLTISNPSYVVTFDANGVMGFTSLVAEPEPEPEAAAAATWAPAFNFQESLAGNRPRTCYRCRGAGQAWQAGGARQQSVGAAYGMSSSEREALYNSAQSIRTTYSSGTMIVCPVCQGTGRP